MDISGFSSQSSVVTLLKSASSNTNTQNQGLLDSSTSKGNALVELLEKANPEKAAEVRKEQEQANSIIARLEASRVDLQDRIKAAAADKLAEIKEQIAVLKLTGSGNPEATARQVARLAKELAGAASDYANASAYAGDVLSSSALAEGLAPGQSITVTTTEVTEVTVSTLTFDIPAKGEDGQAGGIVQAAERQIAELNQKLDESKADKKFLDEARRLLDELKSIASAAREKLEQEAGGVTNNADLKSAESSFARAEQSLSQLSISITSVSVSTTTTVSISA